MRTRIGAVVLLLTAVSVSAVRAQEARPALPRGPIMMGGIGGGVERIMRLREELKLTESQVQQLEAIRKQQVQAQQEVIEVQSRLAAGQLAESEQTRLRERLQQLRTTPENARERIDQILTEPQREQLRARALRGARARGFGFRRAAPRGLQPDWRGRFGPALPGFRGVPRPPMRYDWFPGPRGQMRPLPGWRWRGEL